MATCFLLRKLVSWMILHSGADGVESILIQVKSSSSLETRIAIDTTLKYSPSCKNITEDVSCKQQFENLHDGTAYWEIISVLRSDSSSFVQKHIERVCIDDASLLSTSVQSEAVATEMDNNAVTITRYGKTEDKTLLKDLIKQTGEFLHKLYISHPHWNISMEIDNSEDDSYAITFSDSEEEDAQMAELSDGLKVASFSEHYVTSNNPIPLVFHGSPPICFVPKVVPGKPINIDELWTIRVVSSCVFTEELSSDKGQVKMYIFGPSSLPLSPDKLNFSKPRLLPSLANWSWWKCFNLDININYGNIYEDADDKNYAKPYSVWHYKSNDNTDVPPAIVIFLFLTPRSTNLDPNRVFSEMNALENDLCEALNRNENMVQKGIKQALEHMGSFFDFVQMKANQDLAMVNTINGISDIVAYSCNTLFRNTCFSLTGASGPSGFKNNLHNMLEHVLSSDHLPVDE